MDLLKTRNRESKFLEACFATNARFVVDNTNPSREERAKYISLAKEKRYEVIGYYFKSNVKEALARNTQRKGKELIPVKGIFGCKKRLALPNYAEGFDKLYYVQIQDKDFEVQEWSDLPSNPAESSKLAL